MQGCVISCGTVVFFQKSRNLSRSLLTKNNFYCEMALYSKKRPLLRSLKLAPKFVRRTQIFTALIIVHVKSVNFIVEASALRASASNYLNQYFLLIHFRGGLQTEVSSRPRLHHKSTLSCQRSQKRF